MKWRKIAAWIDPRPRTRACTPRWHANGAAPRGRIRRAAERALKPPSRESSLSADVLAGRLVVENYLARANLARHHNDTI